MPERRGAHTPAAHPVEALERARCQALATGDLDTLEPLLAPDLLYVHSTGQRHDRHTLLRLLSWALQFNAVERRHFTVTAAGDTAWTTGLMRLSGRWRGTGEPIEAVSFVTQVWRQQVHGGWQLALLQSTRVADAEWGAARAAEPR